jgi:telomere length regulation protein
VRKAVLFAAACILVALHPAYVSSALLEGNVEISNGLEWIRTYALDVADSDTDKECYTVRKENFESFFSFLTRFSIISLYFGHKEGLILLYALFSYR